MNPIQKQWLVVGAVVMSVMLICPPWTKITHQVVLGRIEASCKLKPKRLPDIRCCGNAAGTPVGHALMSSAG